MSDVHLTIDASQVRDLVREIRAMGDVKNFIDPSAKIHDTTCVWHFAVILAAVEIGHNCSIGSGSEIGRGTRIGNHTRIGSQCFLPPNSTIGNCVFIGPGVRCADDRHPFVRFQGDDPAYTPEPPVIEDDATVGLGAVLLPGVRIGKGAIVAAGTIVTRDVPPGAAVRSEPGRLFVLSANSRAKFERVTVVEDAPDVLKETA